MTTEDDIVPLTASAEYNEDDGTVSVTIGADTFKLDEMIATELYFDLGDVVLDIIARQP